MLPNNGHEEYGLLLYSLPPMMTATVSFSLKLGCLTVKKWLNAQFPHLSPQVPEMA